MSGRVVDRDHRAGQRWPQRRRWLWRGLLAIAVLLVAAEIIARFVLGMGDPPLYIGDDEIGYLAKPSREYSRFGNRVAYNQWSMRSEPFGKAKSTTEVGHTSGATVVELGPAFKAALQRGERPFRDDIHPSEAGQTIVADVLLEEIVGVANLDQPPRPPG